VLGGPAPRGEPSAGPVSGSDRVGDDGHRAPLPSAGPAVAPQPPGRVWLIPLAVLVVGSFMSVLDTSIVNVAIPKMQFELNAAPDDVQWIATAYTLALGVVVPLTTWLAQRFGPGRLYAYSLLGFALTSALCGLAWDLPSMVVLRVLQAVPGGVLPVISLTLLLQTVPTGSLGAAMGLYGLGIVVAPAVGPVLGGYFVEYADWRMIFFVNVPVGVLGMVAAFAVLDQAKPTTWPGFDFWGFITVAYGLFALLLAFAKGQKWGWTSYPILILFVSGLLSLATWVFIELEVENPLIDVRVFTAWPYVNSLVLAGVSMAGLFSALFFIPQYLQVVQGMQALDAGLVMLPAALVMLVMMPVAGRIYDLVGPRWPAVIGLLLMAFASYRFAQITPDTPRPHIMWALAVRNFGSSLAMMPMMTAGLAALKPAFKSAGSAMNNIMQRLVGAVAVAVFSGLNTFAVAQLTADRGALTPIGSPAPVQYSALAFSQPNALSPVYLETHPTALLPIYQQTDPAALLSMYAQLQRHIVTRTYANGFYVVSILCLVGTGLALLLRSGKPSAAGGGQPHVVEG
jgi:EmrB/QacA subfamily drug resistance transporter